jgi:hypothetical protein
VTRWAIQAQVNWAANLCCHPGIHQSFFFFFINSAAKWQKFLHYDNFLVNKHWEFIYIFFNEMFSLQRPFLNWIVNIRLSIIYLLCACCVQSVAPFWSYCVWGYQTGLPCLCYFLRIYFLLHQQFYHFSRKNFYTLMPLDMVIICITPVKWPRGADHTFCNIYKCNFVIYHEDVTLHSHLKTNMVNIKSTQFVKYRSTSQTDGHNASLGLRDWAHDLLLMWNTLWNHWVGFN